MMVIAVAMTNLDYSPADLRRLMAKEPDGKVVRRLSALALVLSTLCPLLGALRDLFLKDIYGTARSTWLRCIEVMG